MTWGEATMFTSYLEKQVTAIGYSSFHETEALLDNQADISIMRPGLLCAFKPAEKTVCVNEVGSLQLMVDRKGYLEDFFDIYASEHTYKGECTELLRGRRHVPYYINTS
jgi:hypothetical protein